MPGEGAAHFATGFQAFDDRWEIRSRLPAELIPLRQGDRLQGAAPGTMTSPFDRRTLAVPVAVLQTGRPEAGHPPAEGIPTPTTVVVGRGIGTISPSCAAAISRGKPLRAGD